jgi:hypothetical protein
MALWGNRDLVGKSGTITINLGTEVVTGSGTTFNTTGFKVSEGDVIVVGAGATYGHAVISSVTNDTVASIATTQYLIPHPSTGLISGASYFVTQRPISSLEDSNYQAPDKKSNRTSKVFGVDANEVGVAATTPYSVTHSGWVGLTTYIDQHGNLRVKSEVLVAGGIDITAGTDADDDAIFPDPIITIISQPEDAVGVATDGEAVFVVEAEVTPDYAPLSFQWFEDTTELSDDSEYSGSTTSILTVQNDSDKDDGREYTVVITSGDTSVVSTAATVTYA